jgi:hypothetical protein
MNKKEKLGQLVSCYPKFLKDGFTWNVVKNICNVYLKHHPIKMDIQSGPNTMDHSFIVTTLNWCGDKWKKMHHEIASIKPCSQANIMFLPL